MEEKELISKQPIAIVAHDAGAANLILGWLKQNKNIKFNFCLTGPAIKIFEKEINFENNQELETIMLKSHSLVSGTSYKSILEHNARLSAKRLNIRSIAVIDHWVNYEKRFIREGIKILPDKIWVYDNYAEQIAKNIFREVTIEKKKNYYLQDAVIKIKNIKKNNSNIKNILYILEPIRKHVKDEIYPYEYKVLDFFLNKIEKFRKIHPIKIYLRLHPSEKDNKYQNWLIDKKDFISITSNKSLEQDIAWADIVIGYESFALVIANAASKRCFSSKLPGEEKCRLKIDNIEYLREIF